MKLRFSAEASAADAFAQTEREFIVAAQEAVKDAGAVAVQEGRANIASAGFSSRWQNALQSKFFANQGPNPAVLIFHTIPFAGVFERGVTIRGQPLLWIPLEDNLPAGVRSPRKFGRPLVSVNVAGRPPLLFDKQERVPVFFGVRSVTLRKRFNLYAIFARVASRLPEFLQRHLPSAK